MRRFSENSSSSGSGGNWYSAMLEKHPVLTKGLSSALIVAGGDAFCQLVIEDGTFDMFRCFRMFVIGGCLVAPALHFWYGSLNRWMPGSGLKPVLARLACDQAIFGPLFIPCFMGTLFALEGRPDQLMGFLRDNYKENLLTNWALWIPFNFLNFRFVPGAYQVLFANFVALIWNTYLSWSSHRAVLVDATVHVEE